MNRDRIDGVIVREAETALIEWAAGRTVDEVLLVGNTEIPGWVVQRTQERIRAHALAFGSNRPALLTLPRWMRCAQRSTKSIERKRTSTPRSFEPDRMPISASVRRWRKPIASISRRKPMSKGSIGSRGRKRRHSKTLRKISRTAKQEPKCFDGDVVGCHQPGISFDEKSRQN